MLIYNRALLLAALGFAGVFSASQASALNCSVTADSWGNGYVVYVDVTNNQDTAVSAWDVELAFNQDVGVYGSWSTELEASAQSFHASNAFYNAQLAPGETASFGVVGSHSGHFDIPECYTPEDLVIEENDVGFCSVEGNIDSNNAGFTGIGFANTDNAAGKQIAWKIDAKYAGAYDLNYRYANGSSGGRPGTLYINGVEQGTVDFASTGAWTEWLTEFATVELSEGENEIILEATGSSGLANVDSLSVNGLSLSPVECVPEGAGEGFLPQSGNPAQSRYNRARTEWSSDIADIILSHQFDNGGWPKNQEYDVPGTGGNGDGESTFDNGATVTEIVYLAQVYQETGEAKYLEAVRKAMAYILEAQYATGGWPQFYPLRGGYSDHVTFNDYAMSRILTVLHNAQQENEPFHNGIFTDDERAEMKLAIDLGIDYILKAQWVQNGELTVWCAQHGVDDYLPKAARAYELESLSGQESVEVIGFLMTQQQTDEIKAAVQAALAWYRSPNTILEDYVYDRSTLEKIVYQEGGRMWYRFYDLETNEGFFSDRDGGKYYDIMVISEERREGYSWGGSYGERLINYANSVGY